MFYTTPQAAKIKTILPKLYRVRYSSHSERIKGAIWRILCEEYLQRFVMSDDVVLDIAAGHCEFINHIKAGKKYALDIDKRVKEYAGKDVEVFICSSTKLPKELTSSVDIVFMGCFLEHLPSKDAVIESFLEVKRVLRKGGKLLILNPNIRFSTSDYWDYFDHLIPVSDRSIVEVLQTLGFTIQTCIPRFVPNTIKDTLPKIPFLVKLYLHLPILFPIFGKQMFIVAVKP